MIIMLPLATFGNLFGPDALVIGLILLLLFGAKKLPELARGLGQSLNEFKKAREDFEHELRGAQQDPDAREAANRQQFSGTTPAAPVQALPYTGSMEATPAGTSESPEVLRLKVEQLQQQLREMEANKNQVPHAPV